MSEIIYKDESFKILGACFNVYNIMGCGFLEGVYQECLEIELGIQQIPFHAKKELILKYKDQTLKHRFQPDFICFEKIIVEIKAVSELVNEFRAQILNYLNASKMKLGILVNFGASPKLKYERFVF